MIQWKHRYVEIHCRSVQLSVWTSIKLDKARRASDWLITSENGQETTTAFGGKFSLATMETPQISSDLMMSRVKVNARITPPSAIMTSLWNPPPCFESQCLKAFAAAGSTLTDIPRSTTLKLRCEYPIHSGQSLNRNWHVLTCTILVTSAHTFSHMNFPGTGGHYMVSNYSEQYIISW